MEKFSLVQYGDSYYVDSREVAKMIEKQHGHLVRDIEEYRTYMEDGQNPKLDFDDFFKQSSYTSGTGKAYKCYLITKKGCELIAHKLTGKRGVQFSATYITKFHEMERQLSGGLEIALLNGLEEIRELKAQLMREQRLLTGKAKSEDQPDGNFWSIRAYGDFIGAVLPDNISSLAHRASYYSKKHGVKMYKKRYNGSAAVAFHIDVLKWLFSTFGSDCYGAR